MTLIRFGERPEFWNPWSEFDRIRQGLERLSSGYRTGESPYGRATVFPAINIFAQREGIVVTAELPGVRTGDLDISLEGDTLTIKGKRDPLSDEEKVSHHRREITSGSFSRAVNLPLKVNPDTVKASLADGILTVSMEKAAEIKPRQVQVVTE